jgi:ethanolamine utilization cobalamin adenosyltransferase
MAEKDAPDTPKKSAGKPTASKKVAPKKKAAKKPAPKDASSKAPASKKDEHVTVDDMHKLLGILQEGLASRDKAMDYLVTEITLNQEQIAQNKKILAKRGTIYKFVFVILAIGIMSATFSQHTVIKSFDDDMTNVSNNMDVMRGDMSAMRKAMETMSTDMHSMSVDFRQVSKDVSSINKSVVTMSKDVKIMSYGVSGMSYDTYEMNRSMDTMVPPWSPFR